MPQAWSFWGILFNFVMFVVMARILWPNYIDPAISRCKNNKYLLIIWFFFCILSFWGPDYFGYLLYYDAVRAGSILVPLESKYFDIIRLCDNYIIFRSIVWGGACIGVCILLRILRLNIRDFFLFFIIVFITKYSYARVFLVFSLCCLGLSIFLSYRKVFYKIIGICLLVFATGYHKSALFGVSLAFIALIIPPLNKRAIKIFYFSYPILVVIATYLIGYVINIESNDDLVLNSAKGYLGNEVKGSGVGILIEDVLTRLPFYLGVWVYIRLISKGKIESIPTKYVKFGTYSFLIVSIATLFFFDHGANTKVFYHRLLYYASLPISIFLGYCYSESLELQLNRTIIKIGLAGSIYTFIYTMYNALY